MKKSLLKLLVIAILCAIITVIFCVCSIYNMGNAQSSTMGQIIDEVVDTNSPLAGWQLLFGVGIGSMADVGIALAMGFLVIIIPGFLLLMIAILQSISNLIQIGGEKHWKNTTSKVLTYISIVLQVLVCLLLLFDILNNNIVNKMLLVIALILNIICIFLFIKELSKIKKNNT